MNAAALIGCAFLSATAVLVWPGRRRSGHRSRLAPMAGRGPAVTGPNWPRRSRFGRATSEPNGQRRSRFGPAATRAATVGLQPDLVMELVACGLRAGLSVSAAVAAAGEAAREPYLAEVLGRLRLGVRAERAWARPPPEYAGLARALLLAELSGAPAASVVSRAAADVRAARREQVELAAARLGVRLVLPLGLAVLPGFVLLAVVPIVLGLAATVLRTRG